MTENRPMVAQTRASAQIERSGWRRVFTLITGVVFFGLLAYMLIAIVHQIVVPPPAHRLVLIEDVPLPSGLGATSPGQTNPLAPGVAQDFDHFDFQAYDIATHQLFIAHTGPNPDLLALAHTKFDPKYDGHIIVFDAQDNIIYDIDVHTLKATPIALPDNEGPDAISYDPTDKTIFVSDPGSPADPNKTLNPDRSNENVAVIDAVHDKFIKRINLGLVPLLPGEKVPANQITPGNIPLYGHDVGHNKYDDGLHMLFVTSQVLPNGDDPNPFLLPPPGTGELFEINPVTLTIVKEINLPATCSTPHGMTIDSQQHVGFIACTDFGGPQNLLENLARVDLRTMTVIPTDPSKARLASAPDIVVIDTSLHVLFVGCKAGISIFDEKAGEFHKLSDQFIGKQTHTIAIDEQTQEVFLPIIIGGRPILRIARYNPNGV